MSFERNRLSSTAPTSRSCLETTYLLTNGYKPNDFFLLSKTFNKFLLFFVREAKGHKPMIVVFNLGQEWRTVNLTSLFNVPKSLKLVVASIKYQYVDK